MTIERCRDFGALRHFNPDSKPKRTRPSRLRSPRKSTSEAPGRAAVLCP
jgi:hypothetical protein